MAVDKPCLVISEELVNSEDSRMHRKKKNNNEDQLNCIVCKGDSNAEILTTSQDGRTEVLKASLIRKDSIATKLKRNRDAPFCYHASCYYKYVQKTYV